MGGMVAAPGCSAGGSARQAHRHRRHGPDRHARSRAAPRHSACRSTITTASGSARRPRTNSRRPIGKASTRCSPASISSPSIVPSTPATFHLAVRAAPRAAAADGSIIVNTARGDVVDESGDDPMLLRDRTRSPAPVSTSTENEPAVNPKLVKLAHRGPGRAAAAYEFGDDRRPHRHGRQGDHQHPHLHRRPPPAEPRAARPLQIGESTACCISI